MSQVNKKPALLTLTTKAISLHWVILMKGNNCFHRLWFIQYLWVELQPTQYDYHTHQFQRVFYGLDVQGSYGDEGTTMAMYENDQVEEYAQPSATFFDDVTQGHDDELINDREVLYQGAQ